MKLSIITINYNNAEGLKRTMESIVTQNKEDFEYIVIDGNSTDSSVDIIKEYKDKVDYWISEPDSGIYNAMNKGIRKAQGEYLLFINSGDIIHPDKSLKNAINQIIDEDIISFNLEMKDLQNNISYIKHYPSDPDFKHFIEDTLPHTGSFIKRQRLVDYGCYAENTRITSDWAFFMDAICLYKYTYKHIDDHFSTFYLDGISSVVDNRKLIMDERRKHIVSAYPLYSTLYDDWKETKQELYKLKTSVSVRLLKKLGFLKWLKL